MTLNKYPPFSVGELVEYTGKFGFISEKSTYQLIGMTLDGVNKLEIKGLRVITTELPIASYETIIVSNWAVETKHFDTEGYFVLDRLDTLPVGVYLGEYFPTYLDDEKTVEALILKMIIDDIVCWILYIP